MKTRRPPIARVLCAYPCAKGFAFAVFETRGLMLSWGIARLYSTHEDEFCQRLRGLVGKYRIRIICVETVAGSR